MALARAGKTAARKPCRSASRTAAKKPAKAAGAPPCPGGRSLLDPALYLNRELTWLAFNSRVLHEAEDERTPLLERVKFLAITAANLDEFFMKRIGGLKQQVEAGVQKVTVDGRTPARQIQECHQAIVGLRVRMEQLAVRLVKLLRAEKIDLVALRPAREGGAGPGPRRVRALDLPAGHAPVGRPRAPLPLRLEPLAQPAGDPALPRGHRTLAGARQGPRRRRRAPLPAGRREGSASCRSRRCSATTSTCSSPAWRSCAASSSA